MLPISRPKPAIVNIDETEDFVKTLIVSFNGHSKEAFHSSIL